MWRNVSSVLSTCFGQLWVDHHDCIYVFAEFMGDIVTNYDRIVILGSAVTPSHFQKTSSQMTETVGPVVWY